eukprot:6452378-Pyramimonas_sp.AAC.1
MGQMFHPEPWLDLPEGQRGPPEAENMQKRTVLSSVHDASMLSGDASPLSRFPSRRSFSMHA